MRDYGVWADTIRVVKVSSANMKSFDDIVLCAKLHGACGDESLGKKFKCASVDTAMVATIDISVCTMGMLNVRFKNEGGIVICGLIDTGCTNDLFHADVAKYINVLSVELVNM